MAFIVAVRAREGPLLLQLVTTPGRPETSLGRLLDTLAAIASGDFNDHKGASMKSVLVLTAIALASAATLVMAHPEGQPQRGAMFERLRAADTNGDGLISRAEAAALPRIAEHFAAIDANGDGQISVDELRASHRKARGERFLKHLDTDGDGRVSKAEALAKAAARFDLADANKDGFITAEELAAARQAHRGPRGR
jgi:EF hand domain-containing protein